MESPLISVIIPVYKVEKYLEKCVRSVTAQTYGNLEIILVDDGSPDRCPEMCDNLAEQDKRIRVLHKKNGGLSDARNAGIDASSGEYISFVDSDDYVNVHFIELLYKAAARDDAEISVCGYRTVYPDSEPPYDVPAEETAVQTVTYLGAAELFFAEASNVKMTLAWNKLYKRELFDEIRFPAGKICEDNFTSGKLLLTAEKTALTDAVLYYYLQRSESIIHSCPVEKSNYIHIEALDELEDFCVKNIKNEKEKNGLIIQTAKARMKYVCRNYGIFHENRNKEEMDRCLKAYRLYRDKIYGYGGKPEPKYSLLGISPALFVFIRKIHCSLKNLRRKNDE